MAEPLRLFVSATQDLESERAVIGRALARLPVQAGMEIRRTPASGASWETMHELVAGVQRVYFLLGEDLSAPAGAEWVLAWQLERSVLPLRWKRPGAPTHLTPAANDFLRRSLVEWRTVASSSELARIVSLDVIELLLHPTNRFGLTVTELGALRGYATRSSALPFMCAPTRAERKGAACCWMMVGASRCLAWLLMTNLDAEILNLES